MGVGVDGGGGGVTHGLHQGQHWCRPGRVPWWQTFGVGVGAGVAVGEGVGLAGGGSAGGPGEHEREDARKQRDNRATSRPPPGRQLAEYVCTH